MSAFASLAEVRAEIDALDAELVALLARRAELVLAAGRLKADLAAVPDPARRAAVIERAARLAADLGAPVPVARATFDAMTAAFVALEGEHVAARLAQPPEGQPPRSRS